MINTGKQKLRSLLFDGDKELVNLNLVPGTGEALSADSLGASAAHALSEAMCAWENGVPSQAPSTGLEKRTLMG